MDVYKAQLFLFYMSGSMGRTQKKKKWMVSNKELLSKRKTRRMNCNPIVEGKTISSNTCYTSDVLRKIRDSYNENHSEKERIHTDQPKKIWGALNQRLVHCKKEDCWLKEMKDERMKREIHTYVFAPYSPKEWKKNPNEWLSNIDILNVLDQYEKKYPEFLFLGPSPIDFDKKLLETGFQCVEREICNLSLEKELKRGKTKIGFIFNLDEHDESGSHWVSLFIDLEEKIVFYFDSAGYEIPNEIAVLKDRLIEEGKQMKPPLLLKYDSNRGIHHQKGDTECGMYSLFFIITMLTGETEFEKNLTQKQKIRFFKEKRIPDKYVEKYRKIYFND
jgi:hypothetical protein